MQQQKGNLSVPIAIIIAGVIVAGAIIYALGRNATPQRAGSPPPEDNAVTGDIEKVKPVSASDHVLGDAKAPVKIVEFSDPECPFCKRFQTTMHQAVKEFNGQVAWVYRHFPLDQLHSKARKETEAIECAGELGGNDKFWAYLDRLFEVTPSNNGLDPAELPKIADYVGLDRAKFEKCLSSGKYAKHVQEDLDDATASGGQGTPWSIVIASNGKKFALSGAQPYEAVKALINLALKAK